MKYRLPAFLILLIFAGGTAMDHHAAKSTVAAAPAEVQLTDGPLKISLCKLKSDPPAYNHKLVEVTGFVAHGFESFHIVEPARVAEAIFDAVKAANSVEGFTGEGGVVTQTINTKNQISVFPQTAPDFDIAEIFAVRAFEDYEGTVQLARGFQGEAPRTNATIAIARSVLNMKR